MAVKIKLKRMGKIRSPHYRVVVADSRTKRDGRAIEEIGKYHPTYDPSVIEIDSERAQYWLKVGAQPTEAVLALFKVTGDWQKFKGLPGAEGTLRIGEKVEKQGGVSFVAAGVDAGAGAKARAAEKAAPAAAEAPAAEAPAADAPAADAPAAEAPAADAPAAEEPAAEAVAPGQDATPALDVTTPVEES
ncbi:MAG TPA: 30S ribosomal protein S16 [Sporichthya sp.]|nr:30S ribosomal protein S16 [Sporichthya sp.]